MTAVLWGLSFVCSVACFAVGIWLALGHAWGMVFLGLLSALVSAAGMAGSQARRRA